MLKLVGYTSSSSDEEDIDVSETNLITPDINVSNTEAPMEVISSTLNENAENSETVMSKMYRQHEMINTSDEDSCSICSCYSLENEDYLESKDHVSTDSAGELYLSEDSDDSSDSSGNVKCSNSFETPSGRICNYCINLNNNSLVNNSAVNETFIDKDKCSNNVDTTQIDIDGNISSDSTNNNSEITKIDIEIKSEIAARNENGLKSTESSYSVTADENSSVTTTNMDDNENKMNGICTCGRNKNIKNNNTKTSPCETVKKKKKKKALYDDIDLPPIEDLHISVKESESKPIGTILHTVGNLVVVRAYRGIPAIDLDSVLFLDNGKRALGCVDDVFGPVYEPHYVIRFNSVEHIKEKNIEKDETVYFAPQTEHTTFVILDELLCAKGSDASWNGELEPPEHHLDYSDDEEERKAKALLKAKKTQASEEVTVVKEGESQRKRIRSDQFNPFSQNLQTRHHLPRDRFVRPQYDYDDRPVGRRGYNAQRSNVEFGGHNLRDGARDSVASHSSRGSSYNHGNYNPFNQNIQHRPSFPNVRYTRPQYGYDDRLIRRRRYDAQRSNVRFGGPPNLRNEMRSPFVPRASWNSSFNHGARPPWSGNSAESSSHFNSPTQQQNFQPDIICTPPPPPQSPCQYGASPQIHNSPIHTSLPIYNTSKLTPSSIHNSLFTPPPPPPQSPGQFGVSPQNHNHPLHTSPSIHNTSTPPPIHNSPLFIPPSSGSPLCTSHFSPSQSIPPPPQNTLCNGNPPHPPPQNIFCIGNPSAPQNIFCGGNRPPPPPSQQNIFCNPPPPPPSQQNIFCNPPPPQNTFCNSNPSPLQNSFCNGNPPPPSPQNTFCNGNPSYAPPIMQQNPLHHIPPTVHNLQHFPPNSQNAPQHMHNPSQYMPPNI